MSSYHWAYESHTGNQILFLKYIQKNTVRRLKHNLALSKAKAFSPV